MIKTKSGKIVTAGKRRDDLRESPPSSPFLVFDELKQYGVPHSRKHLLDLMRKQLFPQARQLSANRVAWLRTEILDYVANRPISRVLRDRPAAAPAEPAGHPLTGA
jgi:predicted DNA-binding transcriptional regulator AlpA